MTKSTFQMFWERLFANCPRIDAVRIADGAAASYADGATEDTAGATARQAAGEGSGDRADPGSSQAAPPRTMPLPPFFRKAALAARTYAFDAELDGMLAELAEREQRPKAEVASELLSAALAQRGFADSYLAMWRALSPREQQVSALVSCGYTNQQIADRLVISIETVKTHVQNICRKFGMRTKNELQKALENWDFSAWE